jgi:hypothetical protein
MITSRPTVGVTPWWVSTGFASQPPGGRDNAILPEPTPSHANCLKTRTAKRPTTTAPTLFAGDRVHAVLATVTQGIN